MSNEEKWETVCSEQGDRARRLRVPGGWLYQVERFEYTEPREHVPGSTLTGWSPPVFVADVSPAAASGPIWAEPALRAQVHNMLAAVVDWRQEVKTIGRASMLSNTERVMAHAFDTYEAGAIAELERRRLLERQR